MTTFAENIAGRARWALDHNGGHPNPAWSTGERLIVALILGDQATLDAEMYTRQQALDRLAGDLEYHGYTAGAETWVADIKGAL